MILLIILIIVIINLNRKIKQLLNENAKLKEQLNKNLANQSEHNNVQKEEIDSLATNINTNDVPQEQLENNTSKEDLKIEKESNETRNTSILITGVLFIVIAAIVFLTSTWYTIPNIVKTAVIFLLIGAFWGASKIAQDKFHLPKASKAFFYISMAYIPICLVSCSFFGLFGNYFSIFGEGRYIYLTLTLIILAIVYGYNYYRRRDNLLLYGTMLSQILAVILFTLILEKNILVICINLLIYNVLLILLKNKIKMSKIINYFCLGITVTVAGISLFYIYTANTLLLILWLILALNFVLLRKENTRAYSFALNITLYILGIYMFLVYFNLAIDLRILLATVYVLCLFGILDIISSKKNDTDLRESSLIINIISIFVIYIYSLFNDGNFMKPFILCAIETILLFVAYLREKQDGIVKNVYGYLIPCAFLVTIIHILIMLQANFYAYIVLALAMLTISDLKVPKQFLALKNGFSIIAQILIILTYIAGINIYDGKTINLFIAFIVSAYLIFNNFKYRKNEFLRITPILGLFVIFMTTEMQNQNIYQELLMILSTIALTIISIYKNKLSIDTIYAFVYLFATLECFDNIFLREILFIVWSITNLIFIKDKNGKNVYKASLYCGIFAFYFSFIDELNLGYNSFQSIGITILSIVLLKTIIKNYLEKSAETLEICTLFLVYFFTLMGYANEIDGMIFVLFLVGVVIFSYCKKYGIICMESLGAIIVNVFVLTREFWFSIPWWIYLLVVGVLLIGFAIKNESDENKKMLNIKERIKNIKEKIEK